jgi:hypothetical protein
MSGGHASLRGQQASHPLTTTLPDYPGATGRIFLPLFLNSIRPLPEPAIQKWHSQSYFFFFAPFFVVFLVVPHFFPHAIGLNLLSHDVLIY